MRPGDPDRCPDALLIGAMKSGTTGLANDLAALEGFFCPAVKEPEDLCHDAVLAAPGRARYLRLFAGVAPDICAFEASTAYTKRPLFEAVPDRAAAVLGPEVKLVYMVRDPLARAKSQLSHEAILRNAGRAGCSARFDRAALTALGVVAFSDYRHQLAPWLERFGAGQIGLVRFEDYISDRIGVVCAVARFLKGVEIPRATVAAAIDTTLIHNPSEGRLEPRGLIGRFATSDLYLRRIKGMIPTGLRARLKRGLSSEANPAWHLEGVDLEAELAACSADYPLWLAEQAGCILTPVAAP